MTISNRSAGRLSITWFLVFLLSLLFGRTGMLVFVFLSAAFLLFGLLLGWLRFTPGPPELTTTAPASAHPFRNEPGPEVRRWLIALTAVLALASFLQWRFFSALSARGDALPSFLRSEFVQRVYAVLMALGASLGGLLLVLIPGIVLIIWLDYWNLGDRAPAQGAEPPAGSAVETVAAEPREQNWGHAFYRGLLILLGLSQGTFVLEKGKIFRPDGSRVTTCTGPAYLDVREGQVAIIEDRGHTSDAVCGRVWLRPSQRVTGIADLAVQTAHIIVKNAPTKDGVSVDEFKFSVRYQVGKGAPPDKNAPPDNNTYTLRQSGQYTYRVEVVRDKLWKDTPETYKDGVTAVAENIARSAIGACDLRDVIILSSSTRSRIEGRMRAGIQARLNPEGDLTEVKSVNIGPIDFPEKARQELLDHWQANIQAESGEVRARTEKAMMILKGQGQADAMRHVESVKNEVRDRLVRQINQLVANHEADAERYMAAVQAFLGYIVEDSARSLQLVESLEAMAKSSKAFNLYVASSDLLPAGGAGALPGQMAPPGSQPPAGGTQPGQ